MPRIVPRWQAPAGGQAQEGADMSDEQHGGERREIPELHEAAHHGFAAEAEAEAYDRARPSYPPDAVGWLIDNLGVGPGRRIVDLAADTGKLTALLAGAGARLVAVEPVTAMRERLRARLPGVPPLAWPRRSRSRPARWTRSSRPRPSAGSTPTGRWPSSPGWSVPAGAWG